jgi:hypothetical protein
MNIFDKNNPIHREILREEIAKIIKEQEDFTGPGEGEQLAIDDQGGRTNLRAIKKIADMKSTNPFNRLVIKYLDIVNKDTINDITVEQSYDLLSDLHELEKELKPKTAKTPFQSKPKRDINPYDMPGGSSTGYMGSTYRGD